MPAIPDLVLYRTIVDAIYNEARKGEREHVYLKGNRLRQMQNPAQQQTPRLDSERTFHSWLRYARYRKQLILNKTHPYLVITDITTFFDSLLHSHVEEVLRNHPVDGRMLDLLFLLLDRLSIRQDDTTSHGIGLPVDEFDCSRTLAHLILFGHDDAMVKVVGEENYLRWMDDQLLAVPSKAAGLRVLSEVGKSLATLHLAPSAKKSRILTPAEVRRHFHLDLHRMLTKVGTSARKAKSRAQWRKLSTRLKLIWEKTHRNQGIGDFDKVLKRFYRLAGIARLRFLRRRSLRDVLTNPRLIGRVCDYMRCSGTVLEYLTWADQLMRHEEQIYPDVNTILIESCLRLEPNSCDLRKIRALASAFLAGTLPIAGADECRRLAPLLLFRFGDRRSLSLLKRYVMEENTLIPGSLVRCVAAVYSSFGDKEFGEVQMSASKVTRNNSADIVTLVDVIRRYKEVPYRFKGRLRLRYDPILRTKYVDTRSLLTVRLFMLSSAPPVAQWVSDWKANALAQPISVYDRSFVERLLNL